MANLASVPRPDIEPAPAPEDPQVFVRTFNTPSGLPWDQARAAELEARHGSPLPISELLHRVKRLEPWSPGTAGRYAVFYVRRRDCEGPFETVQDVDGQAVRVAFERQGARVRRMTSVAGVAAGGAAILGLLGGIGMVGLSAKAETEQRLAIVEQQLDAKQRRAERAERDRLRAAALVRAKGEAGDAAQVAADLAWLARAKTPDARIVAVHWDRGLMAIESRGEAPPVTSLEREVVRAKRPIRPGVHLWGVNRSPAAAVAAPTVAEAVRP